MDFYGELQNKMKEKTEAAGQAAEEEKEKEEGQSLEKKEKTEGVEGNKKETEGKEKTEGQQQEKQEGSTTPESFKDEDLLNLLKERHKVSVDSIDELVTKANTEQKDADPSELFANETIKSINDFVKETNRDPQDYFKANQDWDSKAKENPNEVVESYLQEKYPELSNEDVKYELEEYLPLEDLDPDEHDKSEISKRERENKKRNNKFKKLLQESKEYFNTQKEKYHTPVKSDSDKLKESLVADSETFQKNMQKVFDESLSELQFSTEEGEFKYAIDNKDKLKGNMSSLDKVIDMFKDENGFNYNKFAKTIISGMNAEDIVRSVSQNAAAKAKEDVLNDITPGRQGSPGEKEGGKEMSEAQKKTVEQLNKTIYGRKQKRKIG